MRKIAQRSRLFLIFLIFISALSFYMARIVYLQFFKSPYLRRLAYKQHNILLKSEPERGDIYDRNMNKLAIDCSVYSVSAMPRKIEEKDRRHIAHSLSSLLKMDGDLIYERLNRDKSFVWIKREVEKEVSDKIIELNLKGIKLMKERKRFYPNGEFASHVIGFTGVDDIGLEGVEYVYDGYLRGSPGWRWTVIDAKKRDILSGDTKAIPPSDGLNIILTIDGAIQHIAERELDRVYKEYKAKSASIIVMDPHNGDILALANRPSFDLNDFTTQSKEALRNRAVTDLYEPGSIFKIVTASCAIERGVADVNKEFFCENGQYYVGGRVLHDHKPFGTLTFREVIEKSSNIGVTKIAQLLGKERLYTFIRLFGFGETTGIDMPGEARGIIRPPGEWSETSISAVPIGQEVAVTSCQLIVAISAIANGGYIVRPRVVREIVDREGNPIKFFPPAPVRRILSRDTAEKMKDILKGVIEKGTGRRARLDGYAAGGKTGTAQKIGPDGAYSHTKFIASFMGFAPFDNPKIAIIISVDEPGPVYYGGLVAAPVFKKTATDILRYLKIEPDIITAMDPGGL